MMDNVVSFPKPRPQPRVSSRRDHANGAKTLFVHIRRATLIAHLSGRFPIQRKSDERATRP